MNPFKDAMGKWITTGLFKEISQSPHNVIWTLEEARALFVQLEDPTGYYFATTHMGGWDHWQALKASPTMAAHLAKWEEELEVKLRARGMQQIIEHAKGEKGYQAAKYLTEASWIQNERGRPSKEKIDKEARIRSKLYDEFKADIPEYKQ